MSPLFRSLTKYQVSLHLLWPRSPPPPHQKAHLHGTTIFLVIWTHRVTASQCIIKDASFLIRSSFLCNADGIVWTVTFQWSQRRIVDARENLFDLVDAWTSGEQRFSDQHFTWKLKCNLQDWSWSAFHLKVEIKWQDWWWSAFHLKIEIQWQDWSWSVSWAQLEVTQIFNIGNQNLWK